MVERQDIDALLISALYGELTPSEETRLAAHLDSHPADRTALADLTHARGLVRESRLLQVQLEPPPSVSALLMKEAARCAPKPEVREGWFARFVRTFAAHPAMAAAAMLVVVLGVGILVTKRKADFAESTAPATSEVALQERGTAMPAAPAPGPKNVATPEGVAMGSAAATGEAAANVDVLKGGAADNFRVALDDGYVQGQAKEQAAADKKADERQKVAVGKLTKPAKTSADLDGRLENEQAVATGAKRSGPQGIELRTPQPAPKDFADDARAEGKAESTDTRRYGDGDGVDSSVAAESTRAPGAGATAGMARPQDPAASAPTTSTTVTSPPPPRTAKTPSSAPSSPAQATPKPAPRRDAPATKTVDRNAAPRAASPAEEKPADPQLAWARDQHAALIAQVRAGDCKKAASIATAISNRAPAYYQQNVETDRAIKSCVAHINNERERDAEQRSERARANQKRSVNEPAKAAPTTTDAK